MIRSVTFFRRPITSFELLLALTAITAIGNSPNTVFAAQTETDQPWLTDSNDDLTMHFRGTLIDEAGEPIEHGHVSVRLNAERELDVQLDGNAFQFSLPLQQPIYALYILATDKAGQRQATMRILASECRERAASGIQLRLAPATRTLRIITQHGDQPIADANVIVRFLDNGVQLTGVSDASGVAEIPCLPQDAPLSITAWKDQSFVGGFAFVRTPTRDPAADEHEVDMYATREQRVRFVDEAGEPIANMEFGLNVATPAPQLNYLGTDVLPPSRTDKNGESLIRWFPDLNDFHVYPTIYEPSLLRTNQRQFENNCYTFTLKRTAATSRQTISGKVSSDVVRSLGGFQIEFRSFQGETDGRLDRITAFTNTDGTFQAHVLPGATYCYYLNDSEWVSFPQANILYDDSTKQKFSPEISIIEGQRVEIVATQGPSAKPLAGLSFNLTSAMRFDWQEDGVTQHGTLGKTDYVTTDSQGKAQAICSPGELKINSYGADWRFEREVEVTEGEPNIVQVHRAVGDPITVRGLIKPAGMNAEATIVIAAYDGQTSGQQEVSSDEQGQFKFSTKSSIVAIYAYATDGTGSAFQIVNIPTDQITLELQPTVQYKGRLLGDNKTPLANHVVRVKVSAEPSDFEFTPWPRQLGGNEFETTTDANGNFSFDGLPVGVRLLLSVTAPNDISPLLSRQERFIVAGESRPLDVLRVSSSTSARVPASESFARSMKYCELYHLRLMTVTTSDEAASDFAQQIMNDFDENRPILGYLPTYFETQTFADQPDRQEVFDEFKLSIPGKGEVLLAAFESDGTEVARTLVNIQDKDSELQVRQFVAAYEPAAKDATEAFANALEEAKRTDRLVWAQLSQTRCGPCFRLSRWMDEHREVLEKDLIILKIDDVRDKGGVEIAEKITQGRHFGIPFVTIFDGNEQRLADFDSPLGNIGFPSELEGALHLRRMLDKVRKRITDEELDQLIDSLLNE